jgi:GYF domain 2
VTIHVCASDGERIGEFDESDFRENLFAAKFPTDSFYWHEGLQDWHPIADYRALAKTQRISFSTPMARTVRINMEPEVPAPSRKSFLGKLFARLTTRKNSE